MFTVKLKLEIDDLEKFEKILDESKANILKIDIKEKKNWRKKILDVKNAISQKNYNRNGNYNEPDE